MSNPSVVEIKKLIGISKKIEVILNFTVPLLNTHFQQPIFIHIEKGTFIVVQVNHFLDLGLFLSMLTKYV